MAVQIQETAVEFELHCIDIYDSLYLFYTPLWSSHFVCLFLAEATICLNWKAASEWERYHMCFVFRHLHKSMQNQRKFFFQWLGLFIFKHITKKIRRSKDIQRGSQNSNCCKTFIWFVSTLMIRLACDLTCPPV